MSKQSHLHTPVAAPSTAQLIDWATHLRTVGLKATPARIALLQELENTSQPLTIQTLYERVAVRSAIDRVTVYRTVQTLVAHGLLRHVDFLHGHAHYELAGRPHHHHVVCTSCQRIEDVELESTCDIQMEQIARTTAFTVYDHRLEFFGQCGTCQTTASTSDT